MISPQRDIEDIGYLAAQCDIREAEAHLAEEKAYWRARAEYLRSLQLEHIEQLPSVGPKLTARSIIAEMERVGSERLPLADYPHSMALKPGPNRSCKPGMVSDLRELACKAVAWGSALLVLYGVLGFATWLILRAVSGP